MLNFFTFKCFRFNILENDHLNKSKHLDFLLLQPDFCRPSHVNRTIIWTDDATSINPFKWLRALPFSLSFLIKTWAGLCLTQFQPHMTEGSEGLHPLPHLHHLHLHIRGRNIASFFQGIPFINALYVTFPCFLQDLAPTIIQFSCMGNVSHSISSFLYVLAKIE